MIRALTKIYSEYDWKFWKFRRNYNNYWQDYEEKMLAQLQKDFNIMNPEDWYKLTDTQFHQLAGLPLRRDFENY